MSTICQHLYTLGVEVKFTRNGTILHGCVSDCEELGVHIGVHIGVYKPYNWL